MKLLLLISIFVLTNLNGYTQNEQITVTYSKALKKITDNTDRPPSNLKGLTYKLLVNKNESQFFFEKKLTNDISQSNKRFIGRGGGNGIYYTNAKELFDFHQKEYSGQLFLIKKEANRFKWKITKEYKNISGYKCYKAIATIKNYSEIRQKELVQYITVWFAPEISFPYGPAGYDGLPGLVLEAQNGGTYFIANKIEFNSNTKISKPIKGRNVTNKEYEEILTKIFKDRFGDRYLQKKNNP